MSDHFKVYRVADAPQEICDHFRLLADDDPIVVLEKGAHGRSKEMAVVMLGALIGWDSLAASWAPKMKEHETETHIIYTVDRG